MPDFVSVPVPVDRVQEVYELLARQAPQSPANRRATQDGYADGWDQALVDRMFTESSETMRGILYAIAQACPRWLSTEDVSVATGLRTRQVVAALGPFEKRVRGRYGMDQWPFEARPFVDTGAFKYSMSPGTANRIIALVAATERDAEVAK